MKGVIMGDIMIPRQIPDVRHTSSCRYSLIAIHRFCLQSNLGSSHPKGVQPCDHALHVLVAFGLLTCPSVGSLGHHHAEILGAYRDYNHIVIAGLQSLV